MTADSSQRSEHEVAHGAKLAGGDPERTWGWGTPAGHLRARRRGMMIATGAAMGPGKRVLEIGCGTGLFTTMFTGTGASIVAVDLSPDLLALARKRNLPGVTFLEKPFETCGAEGPFDAVVGSSILHHLDMNVALPQILGLLKPGGTMCFAEPNMVNPQIFLQKNIPWLKKKLGDSPDETAFVRGGLRKMMTRAGFSDIEIRPFDWLHPYTPAVLISALKTMEACVERLPLIREFAGSLFIRARRPERT